MPRQPWRKLLYIPQPYPDNYTDSSFLSQLRRNATVSRYSYLRLATDFSLVSLHLTELAMTHIVFLGLYSHGWDPHIPVSLSTMTSVFFYLFYTAKSTAVRSPPHEAFKSAIVITLSFLTLSPVLKSLSESTSSDSIWSFSFWLVLLNTVATDYHFDLSESFSPIFSTNILIAEVTVLASRLDSTSTVFCFMLFAIQIHGLFPLFDTWLRNNYTRAHHTIALAMIIGVTCFIHSMMDKLWLFIWCGIHVGVMIACPMYFILLQKYKDELQGPWDTAKPILNG